jgi:hypothetical protein
MTVGFYEDDRPGEVFVDVARQGTELRVWARATAMLASLLLQHGVPAGEIASLLREAGDADAPCVIDFVAEELAFLSEGKG